MKNEEQLYTLKYFTLKLKCEETITEPHKYLEWNISNFKFNLNLYKTDNSQKHVNRVISYVFQ